MLRESECAEDWRAWSSYIPDKDTELLYSRQGEQNWDGHKHSNFKMSVEEENISNQSLT